MTVATKPPKYRRGMSREDLTALEQVPNVGPSLAADLRSLGVEAPRDLPGRDPFALYDDLCRITGIRHDPCVLDVFISAVRFMNGEPARPWWAYTAERKRASAGRRRETACGPHG